MWLAERYYIHGIILPEKGFSMTCQTITHHIGAGRHFIFDGIIEGKGNDLIADFGSLFGNLRDESSTRKTSEVYF